jgi:HSP20 family protein
MRTKRLPVNLYRSDHRLVLTAPCPGFEPGNFHIEVKGRRLSVSEDERGPGQQRVTYLRHEWSTGPFQRAVTLPEKVDATRANATYDNGVLVVILPVAQKGKSGAITMSKIGTSKGQRIRHVGRDLRAKG